MSEPIRLAAVLVNYRTAKLTLDCLEALVPQLDPERDAAVVVDNASGDGSAGEIRDGARTRGWRAVRVVESPRNGGFGAGNNLGIAAVAARAYLLLNTDTWVRPGAVARLGQTLEEHPRAGLVSPRLEWPDGTPQISCFRLPTPLGELARAAATGPIQRWLARWEVPLPVGEGISEPPWTSFAAVLVRAETLRDVGGLDEGYFLYYEDVDFCFRAARAGWGVVHDPRARVVHLRGGTSPVKALAAERKVRPHYLYASRNRFFTTRYGPWGRRAANLLWTCGWAVARLRELAGRRPRRTTPGELSRLWSAR